MHDVTETEQLLIDDHHKTCNNLGLVKYCCFSGWCRYRYRYRYRISDYTIVSDEMRAACFNSWCPHYEKRNRHKRYIRCMQVTCPRLFCKYNYPGVCPHCA
jgi:hypothetical protein